MNGKHSETRPWISSLCAVEQNVKAVVCLIAHDGVVRPGDWLALLEDTRVSLVIHSDRELPAALRAFRYPHAAVTAWEDISLFNLMYRMVGYVVKTYPEVTYFSA